MPGQFLNEFERKRFEQFPEDIPYDDIVIYFTLSPQDLAQIPIKSAGYNRLGFALQLCILRYLGFCPKNLFEIEINKTVIEFLANQLNVEPHEIKHYGKRDQTRSDHFQIIQSYLKFRMVNENDMDIFYEWLVERALEHDKPSLLFQMACEKLYSDKIVRPGITIIERFIISARQEAQERTYRSLESLLTPEMKQFLDSLLIIDQAIGKTRLTWLRFGATSNTPDEILETIRKLDFLRNNKVNQWELSAINPNRQNFLAQLGRRTTNQGIQRTIVQKKYPLLICFLRQTYEEIIDELIELYDRCLADCNTRSKGDLKQFMLTISKSANEKIILLKGISNIILNKKISHEELRDKIFTYIPEGDLQNIVNDCNKLIRPSDDHSYDFMGNRYSYIRRFAPDFLEALHFKSNQTNDSLIEAINTLRHLNNTGKRKIPDEAPTDFIQKAWLTYIKDESGSIVRRYYEICTLWHLRLALRSGDLWVDNSRRYADPESYLITKAEWEKMRPEACRLLGLPENGEERILQRQKELEDILLELDGKISTKAGIRIENKKIILSPLRAEELPSSVIKLQELISERLPHLDLTELLIEVDSWVHFTEYFEHASGSQPRNKNLLINLYASILAQANNFGLVKMAELSGLSYSQLAWCTNWYIREETLQKGIDALVNYQFHQPLANFFGDGTISSSDGQRFPVESKARNTSIIPKYGYGRILTFYTWTSNQQSQWRCKPIPSQVRDATYVLDGMLDNETELPLHEHTTDTAGYTEMVFAFFDGLSFLFSPRIKDIKDQSIYRIDNGIQYKHLNDVLKGTINIKIILEQWDNYLRVVASLKFGYVTASLFISRLQSNPRQSKLAKAIQEYGKIVKSIYIPKYICREEQQSRVSKQLNKGEALHDLRRWLLFADEGKIRKSQLQAQATQASALTLVTNAIIVWNTRYMQAVIDQLKEEGYSISNDDLSHISPCRFNHINKHGHFLFNVEEELGRDTLRPLNNPFK